MNLAHGLAVLRQKALDLPEYLLADVLFWPMAGANMPKLSLGLMLLARGRLAAMSGEMDDERQAERGEAESKIDASLAQWRVAAETKAGRELHSRVNLWQRFWEEYSDDPRSRASNYATEVTQRAIAALLLRAFPRLAETASAQSLAVLDRSIRRRLKGDQFVWEPKLQPAFPKAEFWFLYSGL